MPRHQKPARLWLEKRPGRKSMWIILDNGKMTRTGYEEGQEALAQLSLAQYIGGGGRKAKAKKPPKAERGIIYFITVEAGDRPIKIGFTSHLGKRVNNIRVAMPFPMVVEAAVEADATTEAHLHKMLDRWRITGEWFRRCPEVVRVVELASADRLGEAFAL